MWVSNLYSVEWILYLWPRYEVDIDLCSSDPRPRLLDSDTWMNCAISLTYIHISFPRGHRNHTCTLVYFSPSVKVRIRLSTPSYKSLTQKHTHSLCRTRPPLQFPPPTATNVSKYNNAHICLRLTRVPEPYEYIQWDSTRAPSVLRFRSLSLSLSPTHTNTHTCIDIVYHFIFSALACTPFVYTSDALSMPRTHAIYLSLNRDMCHTNSFSLLARCTCVARNIKMHLYE